MESRGRRGLLALALALLCAVGESRAAAVDRATAGAIEEVQQRAGVPIIVGVMGEHALKRAKGLTRELDTNQVFLRVLGLLPQPLLALETQMLHFGYYCGLLLQTDAPTPQLQLTGDCQAHAPAPGAEQATESEQAVQAEQAEQAEQAVAAPEPPAEPSAPTAENTPTPPEPGEPTPTPQPQSSPTDDARVAIHWLHLRVGGRGASWNAGPSIEYRYQPRWAVGGSLLAVFNGYLGLDGDAGFGWHPVAFERSFFLEPRIGASLIVGQPSLSLSARAAALAAWRFRLPQHTKRPFRTLLDLKLGPRLEWGFSTVALQTFIPTVGISTEVSLGFCL